MRILPILFNTDMVLAILDGNLAGIVEWIQKNMDARTNMREFTTRKKENMGVIVTEHPWKREKNCPWILGVPLSICQRQQHGYGLR